jgi:hypothetical protein
VPAEPDDPAVLAKLAEEGAADLVALRDSAEKWRNGIAAVTGVVSAGLVFKGSDPVASVALGWRVTLFVLVTAAVLFGVTATYFAIRASAGWPVTARVPVTIDETLRVQASYAAKIRRHQQLATGLATAMIVLLLGSVGLMWFLPRPGTKVARVESVTGQVICGPLVRLDHDEVVVSVFQTHVVVPRVQVRALGEATSCG